MQNIKLAFRSLFRDKTFSIINIVGLSIALIVSVIILLFVNHHYSFDKNINNRNQSYRIITGLKDGSPWACTFATFDKLLYDNPAVETSAVFYKNDEEFDVSASNKKFRICDPVYADISFISYFHIPIKEGNPADLENPNSVLINETIANAIFENENPIGKSIDITYQNGRTAENRTVTIVGLLDNNIKNSHLKYDLIHSKKGFYESAISQLERAKVFGAYAYLTLVPGISAPDFENKLLGLVTPLLKGAHGPPIEAFSMKLQPFSDIHFISGLTRDISTTVKRSQLNNLLIVGLLLFITVALNFLIMNIARSQSLMQRTRILQFLGGGNLSVIKSYFFEVLIIVMPAVLLTFTFIQILKITIGNQYFNGWIPQISSPSFWLFLIFLTLIIVFIATFASTTNFLKHQKHTAKNKVVPLIIFQFAVVIGITAFGLLLSKQIDFVHSTDLGYSPENVMVFRAPSGTPTNIRVFKEKAKTISGVLSVGSAMHYPGFRLQDNNLGTEEDNYLVKFAMVNPDALNTLGIKTIDTFSISSGANFFINQTFYNTLANNYTQEEIEAGRFKKEADTDPSKVPFHVSGVVNDFNYASLYSPIGNFAFFVNDDKTTNYRFLLVRYNQRNTEGVANELKNIAESIYHTNLDPVFLNDQLNLEYKSEEQLLSISKLFIVLTIIIATIGLFAFSRYSIQQRTKEIGIRKVNGAKISEILTMLNRDFVKWVAIAFVIATPIVYYVMNKWLENFAYKTELSWWIFALAGVLALGIALLTVSWQSWRAVTRNPVDALRYE